MRLTLMPATRAAFGFSPTARNLKPRLDRLRIHHTTTVAMIDEDEAEVQVVLRSEQRRGRSPSSFMAGVFGFDGPGRLRASPGVRSIHETR